MRIRNKLNLSFLLTVLAVMTWSSQLANAADNDEQRAPPEARTAGTLGTQVMRAISSIQELMQPEDEDDEPDLAGAKEELDELYERRFERMNDFEKQTVLNFFTNYYLTTENYPEAIRIFEELLTIEELREDTRLRTLKSLGQLQAAEENWRESIANYVTWRSLSLVEDDIVYRGLSYAHYQIEEFAEAEPYWISYMQFVLDAGEALGRDDYAYLNGIYFTLEDYESALELTKTMVVLYNDPTDWTNLSAVYSSLELDDRALESINLGYLAGHFDDDSEYIRLGQSLGGMDIPFSGAVVFEDGFNVGLVERDLENLTSVTQMYLIASEYEKALPTALGAADLDETGDSYDNLGYIHYVMHNYEESAEAFQSAVDKGDLKDRAATLLFLARALIELDDFDGALEAARDSGEAGDEGDQTSASNYIRFVENTQARFAIIEEKRNDAIDFYQPYPSLL